VGPNKGIHRPTRREYSRGGATPRRRRTNKDQALLMDRVNFSSREPYSMDTTDRVISALTERISAVDVAMG
jgi:hypothetical protein